MAGAACRQPQQRRKAERGRRVRRCSSTRTADASARTPRRPRARTGKTLVSRLQKHRTTDASATPPSSALQRRGASRPSAQPPASTAAYASVRLVSSHDADGISDHMIESPVNAASSRNATSTQMPRSRTGVRAGRGSDGGQRAQRRAGEHQHDLGVSRPLELRSAAGGEGGEHDRQGDADDDERPRVGKLDVSQREPRAQPASGRDVGSTSACERRHGVGSGARRARPARPARAGRRRRTASSAPCCARPRPRAATRPATPPCR